MLVTDNRTPQIVQTGPPCWANNPVNVPMIVCNTVADLRKVCLAPSQQLTPDRRHIPNIVLLLGDLAPYDGLLQGMYLAYGPSSSHPDNGGSVIYSSNGRHRWMKIST